MEENKQKLIKLSVSKTNTYDSCKAKYKFVYVQKLPRKEFTYHIFGRFVHRILELFHLEYINGSAEKRSLVMSKVFKLALTEFKGKLSDENKKEAFEILDKYLKRLTLETEQDQTKVLAVEKNFEIEITEGVILIGMIDRIQLDADGILHVVDYKTTKSKTYLQDDSLQLLTYAYVLYKEDPSIKKVRGSYVLLRHDFEYITKEFDIEDIKSIQKTYENYANNILNEQEFKSNPSRLCNSCDYLNICKDGQKFINKDFKSGITKW